MVHGHFILDHDLPGLISMSSWLLSAEPASLLGNTNDYDLPSPSRRAQQVPHPHQVVRRGGEREVPGNLFGSDVSSLPEHAHRFHPAKDLLDPLASLLADPVVRMGGGATVDCRAAVRRVLRHVRGDFHFPKRGNELLRVVMLVRAQADPLGRGKPLDHRDRRVSLRRAGRREKLRVHDQAVPVLHQHVPQVGKSCRHAVSLAVELGLRVGRGCMRVVLPFLSPVVHVLVASLRSRRRIVLGTEAFERRPRLDQCPVHGEVFIGQKSCFPGLVHDAQEELFGDLRGEEALLVLGEGRVVPHGIVQSKIQEPAEQDRVVDLLHEQPHATHGVEGLKKEGLERLLGRDPRAARVGVHLRELGGHFEKSPVDHVPNRSQRMIRGNELLRDHGDQLRSHPLVRSAHNILFRFQ